MQSRKILWLFIGCLFFKFILFDLDWSLNTTFSSFSFSANLLDEVSAGFPVGSSISLYTLQMVSDYSRYID